MVDMRHITLIRVRDLIGINICDAAQIFGVDDASTWLRWEGNQEPVPASIVAKVDAAVGRYSIVCETIATAHQEGRSLKQIYSLAASLISSKPENELLDKRIMQSAIMSILK